MGAHPSSFTPEPDHEVPILCLLLWIKMRDELPGAWWRGKTDKTVKQGEKNHLWPHIHAWTHTHTNTTRPTPREASHASIYLEKENLPLSKDTSCPLPQVLLGIHLISYFKLQCCQCVWSGGITRQNTCNKKSTLFNSWAYRGRTRRWAILPTRKIIWGQRPLCHMGNASPIPNTYPEIRNYVFQEGSSKTQQQKTLPISH